MEIDDDAASIDSGPTPEEQKAHEEKQKALAELEESYRRQIEADSQMKMAIAGLLGCKDQVKVSLAIALLGRQNDLSGRVESSDTLLLHARMMSNEKLIEGLLELDVTRVKFTSGKPAAQAEAILPAPPAGSPPPIRRAISFGDDSETAVEMSAGGERSLKLQVVKLVFVRKSDRSQSLGYERKYWQTHAMQLRSGYGDGSLHNVFIFDRLMAMDTQFKQVPAGQRVDEAAQILDRLKQMAVTKRLRRENAQLRKELSSVVDEHVIDRAISLKSSRKERTDCCEENLRANGMSGNWNKIKPVGRWRALGASSDFYYSRVSGDPSQLAHPVHKDTLKYLPSGMELELALKTKRVKKSNEIDATVFAFSDGVPMVKGDNTEIVADGLKRFDFIPDARIRKLHSLNPFAVPTEFERDEYLALKNHYHGIPTLIMNEENQTFKETIGAIPKASKLWESTKGNMARAAAEYGKLLSELSLLSELRDVFAIDLWDILGPGGRSRDDVETAESINKAFSFMEELITLKKRDIELNSVRRQGMQERVFGPLFEATKSDLFLRPSARRNRNMGAPVAADADLLEYRTLNANQAAMKSVARQLKVIQNARDKLDRERQQARARKQEAKKKQKQLRQQARQQKGRREAERYARGGRDVEVLEAESPGRGPAQPAARGKSPRAGGRGGYQAQQSRRGGRGSGGRNRGGRGGRSRGRGGRGRGRGRGRYDISNDAARSASDE